jgi:hypothetical protein
LAHQKSPYHDLPEELFVRITLLPPTVAILALGLVSVTAQAADYDYHQARTVTTADSGPAPCQMPVVKVYRIKPNFCPTTLVRMIPSAVGPDCCCGMGCGPYGIPPIYASGQNVLVRQTPEMQERVKEFLTGLGALVEPQKTM